MWKNFRVVNTGMPTKRSSPFDFAIISDDIDISDDVELGKAQLPPEQLGRMQHGRQ